MGRFGAMILVVVLIQGRGLASGAAEGPTGEVPEAFRSFEHMVGAWKGMAIPGANRLKGWQERHAWAWTFAEGRPAGMGLEVQGGKILDRARLSFDPAKRRYRLEGTDPEGRPVVFEGVRDEATRALILDRAGAPPDGPAAEERLTIRPNANRIRYTMLLERKERGSPQFGRVIDANLGKEGETFAAGGAAADLPECVLTGGAATMSVSYQGKLYPVCCSGCRDEFLADPEKYVKKAALRTESAGPARPTMSRSRIGGDDGFDGLVSEPKPTKPDSPAPSKKTTASPKPEPAAPEPAPSAKSGADPAARAASLLRSGQMLERLGKGPQALDFYRQVVDGYPDAPQAKEAQARIKALDK